VEEFKREKLPGRYTAKLLYGWDDKKFDEEYLRKLERNWNRWKNDRKEGRSIWNEKNEQKSKRIGGDKKSSSGSGTLRGGYCYGTLGT